MKQQFPSTHSSSTARPPDSSSSIGVHRRGERVTTIYPLPARTNPPKSRIVSRLASSVSAFSTSPSLVEAAATLLRSRKIDQPLRESRIEHRGGDVVFADCLETGPSPSSFVAPPFFRPTNSRKVAETSVFHSPPPPPVVKYYSSSFLLLVSPAYIRP